MKRLLIVIAILIIVCPNALARSLTGGLTSSGIIGANTHVHVTTTPAKIYAITIRATASNGFVNIIDTQIRINAESGAGGAGADWVSRDKAVADIQEAAANVSKTVTFPDGIKVRRIFVDTNNAECIVYYKP